MSVVPACMYIFIYPCIYLYACACGEQKRALELLGELELQVLWSHPTWVLGIKLSPLEEEPSL